MKKLLILACLLLSGCSKELAKFPKNDCVSFQDLKVTNAFYFKVCSDAYLRLDSYHYETGDFGSQIIVYEVTTNKTAVKNGCKDHDFVKQSNVIKTVKCPKDFWGD